MSQSTSPNPVHSAQLTIQYKGHRASTLFAAYRDHLPPHPLNEACRDDLRRLGFSPNLLALMSSQMHMVIDHRSTQTKIRWTGSVLQKYLPQFRAVIRRALVSTDMWDTCFISLIQYSENDRKFSMDGIPNAPVPTSTAGLSNHPHASSSTTLHSNRSSSQPPILSNVSGSPAPAHRQSVPLSGRIETTQSAPQPSTLTATRPAPSGPAATHSRNGLHPPSSSNSVASSSMASVAKAFIPPMASLKAPDAPLPTLPSRVSSVQAATAPDFRQQLTTTASLAVTQPPPSSSSNAKTHSTILAPLTAAQPPSSSSLDLNLSSTARLSGTIEAVTPKPLNVHNTGVRVGHITTQQAAARIRELTLMRQPSSVAANTVTQSTANPKLSSSGASSSVVLSAVPTSRTLHQAPKLTVPPSSSFPRKPPPVQSTTPLVPPKSASPETGSNRTNLVQPRPPSGPSALKRKAELLESTSTANGSGVRRLLPESESVNENDPPASKRAKTGLSLRDAQTVSSLRDLLTDESAQRTQAQTEVVRLRIEHEQLLKNLRDEREAREKADRSLVRLQLEYMARVESEHILGIQLAEEREKRVRAEERSAQVEKELQEVKTTRAEALEREGQRRTCVERVLADVRREQGTVFVVPAMLDAFEKIAYFSDKAMVTTRT